MAKARKYTDQDFIEAVRTSTSIRQVLTKLGLREAGGNYASCRDRIEKLDLSTSHFERVWNKGIKTGTRRPLTEYLQYGSNIQSYRLKRRLIDEGIFTAQCSQCKLVEWLKKPIPLELDHIDGDRKNNCLDNLRLLCPNCHAFTPTYRGKNIGSAARTRTENNFLLREAPLPIRILHHCIDCKNHISSNAKRCKSCVGKRQPTKIHWPSIDELVSMVNTSNYSAVARSLGVSDNAVRKRLKNHC